MKKIRVWRGEAVDGHKHIEEISVTHSESDQEPVEMPSTLEKLLTK